MAVDVVFQWATLSPLMCEANNAWKFCNISNIIQIFILPLFSFQLLKTPCLFHLCILKDLILEYYVFSELQMKWKVTFSYNY